MSAKHTPGPWWHDDDKEVGCIVICAPDGDGVPWQIASMCDIGPSGDEEANARLIAAAPELLAALKSAAQCLAWHCTRLGRVKDREIVQDAFAAIAKAEAAQ
jgi:hypothetical protein